MGVLDTYNNSNFGRSSGIGGGGGGGGGFGYATINEVKLAYDSNKISYNAAYRILMDQFGLSDLDIQDVLVIEPPKPPPPPPGAPDDSEDEDEEIPDTSTDTGNLEITPMTDDQRFLIIGLAVAAALFGFIKR